MVTISSTSHVPSVIIDLMRCGSLEFRKGLKSYTIVCEVRLVEKCLVSATISFAPESSRHVKVYGASFSTWNPEERSP